MSAGAGGRMNGHGGSGRLVAALDVGSSKVVAVLAQAGADGTVVPVGVGVRAASGLRRGLVADMEAAERAIRAAMAAAEEMAGRQAQLVVASIAAGGLASDIASVEVPAGSGPIGRAQLEALLAEARRAIDEPEGRTILHAQPALYLLDGTTPVANPLGFHAARLGLEVHVVTAPTPPIRNLDQVVRNAHLGIHAIVASPLAAGMAVLVEEERDLGVALIELGAGVTTVSAWARGQLAAIEVLPTGAQDITDDLAGAFATRRAAAEKLKCLHGSATLTASDNHAQVEVAPIAPEDAPEALRVTRAQIAQVIRARLAQQFEAIAAALERMGFTGPHGRRVVLTGGGAELAGLAEYAQGALGRQARIGRARDLAALTGQPPSAALATAWGLVRYAAADPDDLWTLSERQARRARGAASPLARVARALRLAP
jgi:cell division protein FtsA